MRSADEEFERLSKLLDVGLDALKKDDFLGAELALKEAAESAQRLPKKPEVICLPDLSKEKPQ